MLSEVDYTTKYYFVYGMKGKRKPPEIAKLFQGVLNTKN